ncbi:MAG TPA: hypothetical protein VG095_02765, partial [Chthoniobacterales bacterium]|nr:hypothetical protein [Chthoniobacterales bacterium]
WKFPLKFQEQAAALSIVHLLALGLGGYVLARGRRLTEPTAVAVGCVAALNGWIICWGATDWFGALAAFCWFPWAWWALERAKNRDGGRFRFLWPIPFVYLLVTGGFPYTVLMLALLIAWLCLRSLVETRSLASVIPMLVGVLLGVGLAAPAWLALLDYIRDSGRGKPKSLVHFEWAVPAGALPGFILPAWTVRWANFSGGRFPHVATELASGLFAPAALVFAFVRLRGALLRRLAWDLGLLALVLTIAILPSLSVFRWSFRWLPFVHVLLALCAAEAVTFAGQKRVRWGLGVIALALVLTTGLATWLTNTAGPFGVRLFGWIVVIAFLWAILEYWRLATAWLPAAVTFASLLATYFCIPPNRGVPRYRIDQSLAQAEPLDPERLYLSVYPPPHSTYGWEQHAQPIGAIVRPGSTSMFATLRFINGYSPIRPAGVARALAIDTHGDLEQWRAAELLDWEAGPNGGLARLGVDGVAVSRHLWWMTPQPAEEWAIVHTADEGTVYHRKGGVLPRARFLPRAETGPDEGFATASVNVIEDSRLRVVADVNVPGRSGRSARLSFSRPFFRGYRATLNGRSLPVTSWQNLNPEVEVPAGESGRLVLVYRPGWLIAGLWIAALSVVVA